MWQSWVARRNKIFQKTKIIYYLRFTEKNYLSQCKWEAIICVTDIVTTSISTTIISIRWFYLVLSSNFWIMAISEDTHLMLLERTAPKSIILIKYLPLELNSSILWEIWEYSGGFLNSNSNVLKGKIIKDKTWKFKDCGRKEPETVLGFCNSSL